MPLAGRPSGLLSEALIEARNMKLVFEVKLSSDYHVSAGHGKGTQLDSALFREPSTKRGESGQISLRGTTPTGLMRNALRELLDSPLLSEKCFQSHKDREDDLEDEARQATEGNASAAQAWCENANECALCRIFGTPASPKAWRFSTASAAQQYESAKVMRNRVSLRTRRAEAQKLFSQEEGNQRLAFEFAVSRPGDNDAIRDEAALLVAAARMLRRFGAARNRGRGQCVLHLKSVDDSDAPSTLDFWMNRFQEAWVTGTPSAPTVTAGEWNGQVSTEQQPIRFRVLARSEEPLMISRRSEAGNMYDALPCINGSSLWGAMGGIIAQRWQFSDRRKKPGWSESSSTYDAFRKLLLDGGVHFSPLYPVRVNSETQTYQPTIPAPLDLMTCKAFAGDSNHFVEGMASRVARGAEVPPGCPKCKELHQEENMPLQRIEGFVSAVPGSNCEPVKTKTRDELHPRINPKTQKVSSGDLFGYIPINRGQYFLGELTVQNESAWNALRELTGVVAEDQKFSVYVGKATKRGYGRLDVVLERITDNQHDWCPAPVQTRVPKTDGSTALVMTCLSDAILPDSWGRFHQSLGHAAWLESLLNDGSDGLFLVDADDHAIKSFCKSRPIDGFANHLGLPRWRDIAVVAGSVVGFKVTRGANATDDWQQQLIERLAAIELAGIGVRRQEGFGRVAFNHPLNAPNGNELQVATSPLTVPEGLRGHETAKPIGHELTSFQQELQGPDFKANWFRNESWDAFARWLWSESSRPVDEVIKTLRAPNAFGKGNRGLLTDAVLDTQDDNTDKGLDQKTMKYVCEWLEKIQSRFSTEGPIAALSQQAIRSLADRISECSR